MNTVMWFRRDLRLRDHPALAAAIAQGTVVPLFVLDPSLLRPAGAPRVAYLLRTLQSLDAALKDHGARLVIRTGKPEDVVVAVSRECAAVSVHVSADYGPYGKERDAAVAAALDPVPLVASGSPYAIDPGGVRTPSGGTYKVFSAFYRASREQGWPAPVRVRASQANWLSLKTEMLPPEPKLPSDMQLPAAGEEAARKLWRKFRGRHLREYDTRRDRPDLDQTSRLSAHLHFGTIHPRTVLRNLRPHDEGFARELAWREFYAAVLAAWPDSARESFQPSLARLKWERGPDAEAHLAAWKTGHTGYPLVDAGMRQLAAEGFMHNRVRMVVASFLVKDLHLDWRQGARHFMRFLVDGDLASNQHGWQWVAGTGTDAAPYHRILNPIMQARRFDPDGDYVRRWVPELAGLHPPDVFEPWNCRVAQYGDYVAPIVDHAEERVRALSMYGESRRSSAGVSSKHPRKTGTR